MTRPGKTVAETAVTDHTYKVFPNDLNSHGTVFGGMVMSQADRVANVVAERHSERLCVTASVDSMHFLAPARRGETLVFMACVNRAWRSSMEVGVKVVSENYRTGNRAHILSAYFTFVAVDDEHQPCDCAPVIPQSPIEKRRFEEAGERRRQRQEEAAQRRARRQQEPLQS